jgi:putative salt-induced outer membrane protein YdiY
MRCPRSLLALLSLAIACSCTSLRESLGVGEQRDDTLTLPPADEPIPSETPQIPLVDDADWMQLVSGEWLRGTLVRIRDGQVDFDSDELDELSIDLDDVKTVRTAETQVVVTDANQTLRGKLVLQEGYIWIDGEQTVRVRRDELLATLAFDGDDAVDWSGGVTLGATARSGNTKQDDLSAFAEATRETARTRWRSTYNGAFSRAAGIETTNNHRLRSVYDVFLSKRLFVTVPSLEVYRDRFQNIDYRITPSAAVGYEVVDTARHGWRLSAGPAYQYTRFGTAPPGEDVDEGTAAAVLLSKYSWNVSSAVDFDFDYSITAALPETHQYNHNFVTRVSVDLIGDLDLDLGFVWDRVNRPVADGDGDVPQKDDYRTTIGLGWSF